MIVFQMAFGTGPAKKPIDFFIEGRNIMDVGTLTDKLKTMISGKFRAEGMPLEASFDRSVKIHNESIIKLLAGYLDGCKRGRIPTDAALDDVTKALNNALDEVKKEAQGNIRRVQERIGRFEAELATVADIVRNRMGISSAAVENYEKLLKRVGFSDKLAARIQRRQEAGMPQLGRAGIEDTAKKVGTFPTEQGARDAEQRLLELAEKKGFKGDYRAMFQALDKGIAEETTRIKGAISELGVAVEKSSRVVGLTGEAPNIKKITPDLVKEAKNIFTRVAAAVKEGPLEKDLPRGELAGTILVLATAVTLVGLSLYGAFGGKEPATKGEILFVPTKVGNEKEKNIPKKIKR